jgi:hypothetical protein
MFIARTYMTCARIEYNGERICEMFAVKRTEKSFSSISVEIKKKGN